MLLTGEQCSCLLLCTAALETRLTLNQESRVCVICGPWDFSDCSGIIHSACKGNRGHHEVDQVTDALVFLKAAVYQHERNNLVGSVMSVLQIQELLLIFRF